LQKDDQSSTHNAFGAAMQKLALAKLLNMQNIMMTKSLPAEYEKNMQNMTKKCRTIVNNMQNMTKDMLEYAQYAIGIL
jgi:hypothetical protein